MSLKQKLHQIKQKTSALYLALKRKDTPIPAKIMAGITVGYALSPIDLIPDFIPVLGYLDDILILPLLILLTIKLIPENIMQECETKAKDMWQAGKPVKWYFALPIILIWLLVISIILYNIIR